MTAIITAVICITVIGLYCACVVAGRADDRLREYEERDSK